MNSSARTAPAAVMIASSAAAPRRPARNTASVAAAGAYTHVILVLNAATKRAEASSRFEVAVARDGRGVIAARPKMAKADAIGSQRMAYAVWWTKYGAIESAAPAT